MYTVLLRNCSVTRLAMVIYGGERRGKMSGHVERLDYCTARTRGPSGELFRRAREVGGGTESSGMPMDGARTMRRLGCLGASRINIAFRGDVRAAAAGNSRPFATADHPPPAPLLTTR